MDSRQDSSLSQCEMVIYGSLIGGGVGGFAYAVIVPVLDIGFTPPLKGIQSYGQFGFLVIYLAFFWMLCGGSASLLARWPFIGWLPVYVCVRLLALGLEPELFIGRNWTEVTIVGQLIVDTLALIACYLVSEYFRRRRQSRGNLKRD